MKTFRTITVAVAIAGSSLSATPSSAKTAFQYWAQGQGAYVSSKDHPSEFYEYLAGPYGRPAVPPPYAYDAYGRSLPPPAPYGLPDY